MLAARIDIGTTDLAIIIAYFIMIITVGCLAGYRNRQKAQDGKDYFLAGGTLTWPIIGLALFSTNISTIHLVSQAQEGYMNGLVWGNLEWMAPFTLIALSLFFAPFYVRSRVATLPDFLEKRYGRACRNWLAALSMVSAVFIHIGFSLYTGAVVLKGMFGVPLNVSIIGISILTGLYTIVGGLLAVVVTESIQTIILLAGAFCITGYGLYHLGGWEGLKANVDPVMLTVLRPASDPCNLPWYAVFLGYPVIGLWYWCADQTIVQRVLGAKDERHARVGPLFCGFIKILPLFLFVMPGTLGLALIHKGGIPPLPVEAVQQTSTPPVDLTGPERRAYEVIQSQPVAENAGVKMETIANKTNLSEEGAREATQSLVDRKLVRVRSEDIYAHLIMSLLPVGLKGLVAAALLAALMSTVSGALNSIATLFTYDLYRQLRPQATDRTLVQIGRVVTFLGMIAAIVWTPFLSHYKSIYQGITTIICDVAPPITAVFIWGVFWKRATTRAAFVTLVFGTLLGFVVFILDWYKDYTGWNIPSMMAAFYLCVICSAVLVLVSVVWPQEPTPEQAALCWSSPLASLRGVAWQGLGDFRLLAALLFCVMVMLYVIFR